MSVRESAGDGECTRDSSAGFSCSMLALSVRPSVRLPACVFVPPLSNHARSLVALLGGWASFVLSASGRAETEEDNREVAPSRLSGLPLHAIAGGQTTTNRRRRVPQRKEAPDDVRVGLCLHLLLDRSWDWVWKVMRFFERRLSLSVLGARFLADCWPCVVLLLAGTTVESRHKSDKMAVWRTSNSCRLLVLHVFTSLVHSCSFFLVYLRCTFRGMMFVLCRRPKLK